MSGIDEILKKGESVCYSNKDISRLMDDEIKILTYPELSKYKSLDDVLSPYNYACILYMTKENFGHWTSLIKTSNGYEIFDPYGVFPDEELKFIPTNFASASNQSIPWLSLLINNELINNSNKIVLYNKIRLQEHKNGVNTCGRWCAYRCFLAKSGIDLSDFIKLFINQTFKPDWYITALTITNK